MFTGEYRHTVDEKGRIAVPMRFRGDLEHGAMVCKWIDGCLALFPRAAWEELAAKASVLPVTNEGARVFQRFLFGAAFEIDLDRQGRLVIPAVLREFARLDGEAVVVGSRDHLEVWEPMAWKTFSARMDQPELLAEHLQGLGI